MIVAFSLACTSLAVLTGILAVGSGRHWHFGTADYFRGKRNAVLYAWVTASTCMSLYHSGVLAEYGIRYGWALREPSSLRWFFIHAGVGLLFVAAHLFVATVLSKEVGPVDKYLWGKGSRSAD